MSIRVPAAAADRALRASAHPLLEIAVRSASDFVFSPRWRQRLAR